jgi:hypothetical protein
MRAPSVRTILCAFLALLLGTALPPPAEAGKYGTTDVTDLRSLVVLHPEIRPLLQREWKSEELFRDKFEKAMRKAAYSWNGIFCFENCIRSYEKLHAILDEAVSYMKRRGLLEKYKGEAKEPERVEPVQPGPCLGNDCDDRSPIGKISWPEDEVTSCPGGNCRSPGSPIRPGDGCDSGASTGPFGLYSGSSRDCEDGITRLPGWGDTEVVPVPTPNPLPASQVHVVVKGDTLWEIVDDHLGRLDRKLQRRVRRRNLILPLIDAYLRERQESIVNRLTGTRRRWNPDRIYVGDEIHLPSRSWARTWVMMRTARPG